jgi:Family of unknown function (DUF5681)
MIERIRLSKVGYGNPPKHTRFEKGKSGNPEGRPKGSRNFATVLQDELKRRVPVTEDGKRKKITKREATAKQLANKAASGDLKAIPIVLNETRAYEAAAAVDVSSAEIVTPEDQAVMQSIVRRIREATDPISSTASSEPATPTPSDPNHADEQDGTPQ